MINKSAKCSPTVIRVFDRSGGSGSGEAEDIKRDREIIALVFPEILATRTVLLSCFLMRKWGIFPFRTVECQIG